MKKRRKKRMVLRKLSVCILSLIIITSSFNINVNGAIRQDYGSITLADIILAWYNASGVAIGNTQIANAIISAYNNITLDDLVDNNVIQTHIPLSNKEDIKEMLGYGNLTTPSLYVNAGELRNYLPELPTTNVAYDALKAMFDWEEGSIEDGNTFARIADALAITIGTVANIGKIAYNISKDTVINLLEDNEFIAGDLYEIYKKFTDTTYFQDLIKENNVNQKRGGLFTFHDNIYNEDDIIINNVPLSETNFGVVIYRYTDNSNMYIWLIDSGWLAFFSRSSNGISVNEHGVRCNGYSGLLKIYSSSFTKTNDGKVNIIKNNEYGTIPPEKNIWSATHSSWGTRIISGNVYEDTNITGSVSYICEYANNIYENQGGDTISEGVTDYINNQVGNVTSNNYSILSPNIKVGEYMYLADSAQYIETLNQISNNTNNGDYSQNSTVINNYNNTYIQDSIQSARPTVAPVGSPIPAQPFISPRPTQAPEDYESVVYQGGIPDTIKSKFPFCIPWDLAAMLQNLWAPEARAPYIHWEATFGSYGKLGEVDIDFSVFNTVASIFRSTTLILWIVGLIVITRNMIGG